MFLSRIQSHRCTSQENFHACRLEVTGNLRVNVPRLAAAVHEAAKGRANPDIEGSHALWRTALMAHYSHEVYAHVADIHPDLQCARQYPAIIPIPLAQNTSRDMPSASEVACQQVPRARELRRVCTQASGASNLSHLANALGGISVHQHATPLGHITNLLHWLEAANLIVRVHDCDKHGIVSHGCIYPPWMHPASRVCRDTCILQQPLASQAEQLLVCLWTKPFKQYGGRAAGPSCGHLGLGKLEAFRDCRVL